MKKIILISTASILLIIGGVLFIGCSNNSQKKTNTDATEVVKTDTTKIAVAKYQCPMKCEGDKTYDKPGKCPVCGMNTKKIETH